MGGDGGSLTSVKLGATEYPIERIEDAQAILARHKLPQSLTDAPLRLLISEVDHV